MNVLDVLFPRRCVGCGAPGKYICTPCSDNIRVIAMNEGICPVCEKSAIDGATHSGCKTRYCLDGLTSFFRYRTTVRSVLKAIKYRFVSDMVRELTEIIPQDSIILLSKLPFPKTIHPLLVPIPLHASRLRWRGFNQAEVLGEHMSRLLDIPMRTDLLMRVKQTTPQVEVRNRNNRLKNMEDVYRLQKSMTDYRKLGILLLDDVFTTGATLRSAAGLLKRAGAPFVWGITIAR